MENISNNNVLCINDEKFLENKRNKIIETLDSGIDVFFFYDTETTGLSPFPNNAMKKRDRLLEVAFTVFYLDEDENFKQLTVDNEAGVAMPVSFQEYINPYKESKAQKEKTKSVYECAPRALEVHGITNGFLEGKESLAGLKLDKSAPTFEEVKPFMEYFLCLDKQAEFKATAHFVSHNGISFDDKFLTEEMKYIDAYNPEIKVQRDFESLISSSIDTKRVMQKMFKAKDLQKFGELEGVKPGFSLDFLSKMLKVDSTARAEVHGALLDSIILKDVLNNLIKTKRYKAIKNKTLFRSVATSKEKENNLIPLVSLDIKTAGVKERNILNVIKTDASFNEGTGTIKEYVARAKEEGLNNLLLADVVSISRFIEFYEECKKAEIKPIIGTTFKIESSFDIYNVFSPNKDQGLYMKNLTMKFINKALEQKEGEELTFENLLDLGLTDPVLWSNVINAMKKIELTLNEGKKPSKVVLATIEKLVESTGLTVDKKKLKIEPFMEMIKESQSIINYENFDRITGHSDIILYAEDEAGFRNIKKLITIAHRDGQHYLKEGKERKKGEQPILKLKDIADKKEGVKAIIGSSGDMLEKAIVSEYTDISESVMKKMISELGADMLNLQLTTKADRNKPEEIEKQNKINNRIKEISNEFKIPVLAVQNASFANPKDSETHDHKYAILLDKIYSDFSFSSNRTKEEYLKGSEELNVLYQNNIGLMEETAKVINGTVLNPLLHIPTLPKFKTKDGKSQADELRERAYNGMDDKIESSYKRAIRDGKRTEGSFEEFKIEYRERLDYELGVIIDMDFPGYFLIKQQMIQFCKREGIPVGAGRGSAAGSLVVYSLGITDVDPIEHKLIFERFLNPERKEMPDIDTDIDGDYREVVLNFLRKEYEEEGLGYEGAAFIMTKSTFSAKNTIKSLGKSLGLTQRWRENLASLISDAPGTKLEEELQYNENLIYRYETEVKTKRVMDAAIELEKNGGRQMAIGKHAGGIVVGNLVEQAPITYVGGVPVLQYDKDDSESAGAVKFDLLGLGNLSKLDKALRNIIELKGIEEIDKNKIKMIGKSFNFDDFEYSDSSTYEMLRAGDSTNVFQIESNMFKGLLKLIKPNDIEEITAVISLGRPGPLQSKMHEAFAESKFDPSKREFYHETIDHLLDETHGTIIYQEQIMAIAREMSLYTMGGADKLRKAMGKKNKEVMAKEQETFVSGAVKNAVDSELAEEIFMTVEKFSGYGFNKSHAMAYAFLTYKTAFLRRHYPTEYMAAVLSVDANEGESKKKIAKDIECMKELDLTLFTPQINESESRFKPGKTTAILYGFDGITGLTVKDQSVIFEERNKEKFKNLLDFGSRTISYTATKKLINAGAMDSLALSFKITDDIKQTIKSMPLAEQKIFKRVLVTAELEIFAKTMKSVSGKKKMVTDGVELFEEETQKAYKEAKEDFLKNKEKIILSYLDEEESLLSGFVTAHPLDLGGQRDQIKENSIEKQIMVSELEAESEKDIDKIHNIASMVKTIIPNRRNANGDGTYSLIEVSDGSASTMLFFPGESYNELNGQIKEKNGVGLQEGDVLGLNVGFYKQGEDTKSKVYEVYMPKFKIDQKITERKYKRKNNFRP